MKTTINCSKCKYFYVTWDPKFPKGCKLYGFKSRHLPSITVAEATGQPCPNFTPKKV